MNDVYVYIVAPNGNKKSRKMNPAHINRKALRQGFTLIELMVVVALVALLTGVVVANLRSPLRTADYQLILRKIERLDEQARQRATQGNHPTRLVIDFDTREMRALMSAADEHPFDRLRMGGEFRFAKLVVSEKSYTTGNVEIKIGQHGRSSSYALLVTDGRQDPTWLLIAGGTGQPSQLKEEDEVLALSKN